ncbi:uncharacterized protein LOC126842149 [Adelges cooleyi]|uniref:uncharacterized protein LOC126842149 n=1 Tax=Adelges cooleyi TaxID=133065 RepID=UPI00217F2AC5|nr:uncharacterized protein LOC126842149 [Adelges cooleyi]
MDGSYLDVKEKFVNETPIEDMHYRSYLPFSSSAMSRGDQIRIAVQNTDAYTLFCESYLYIEGKITRATGATGKLSIAHNGLAFLFDEISYEVNGVEVQKVKDPGTTSLIKGYCSYSLNDVNNLQNAYWSPNDDDPSITYHADDFKFSGSIPLSHLFGFAEDYRKIMINVSQQLVLNRSLKDVNVLRGTLETGVTWADESSKKLMKSTVELTKIAWKLPVVRVNDREKLKLLKIVESHKSLHCAFRNWDLCVYPQLPETTKHSWMVKTTNSVERPRYILLAFHTADNAGLSGKRTEKFDSCSITNLKVHLNSAEYPYENELNLNHLQTSQQGPVLIV